MLGVLTSVYISFKIMCLCLSVGVVVSYDVYDIFQMSGYMPLPASRVAVIQCVGISIHCL